MTPAWFAMSCTIHTDPKVLALSADLKLDPDTVVGKLGRLYAWAMLAGNETGEISHLPASEIADIMRWKKKPETLLRALVDNCLIDEVEGRKFLHSWGKYNGAQIAKRRRDTERKR